MASDDYAELIDSLDQQSAAAAQRYGLLAGTWRGLYQAALGQGDLQSPATITRFTSNAISAAVDYMATEYDLVGERLGALSLKAQGATLVTLGAPVALGLEDDTSAHVEAIAEYLRNEITTQINRDVTLTGRQLRQSMLEIGMAAQAQGISSTAAKIQYEAAGAKDGQFRDRAGRRWPAGGFIRKAWRQSLLQAHNDTTLLTLASHGVTQAVMRPAGTRVSLLPGSNLPVYSEIRDRVFHPNSNTVLGGTSQN